MKLTPPIVKNNIDKEKLNKPSTVTSQTPKPKSTHRSNKRIKASKILANMCKNKYMRRSSDWIKYKVYTIIFNDLEQDSI